MKKTVLVLMMGLFLAGCGTKLAETTVEKTGIIQTKSGEEYLLQTDDGIVNMTSNKVDLDNYMKKQVTVKGQFSGSTLYVDEIR